MKRKTIEIPIWDDPVWGPNGHLSDWEPLAGMDLPGEVDGLGVSTYRFEIRLVAVEVYTELNEGDGGPPGGVETLEWRKV